MKRASLLLLAIPSLFFLFHSIAYSSQQDHDNPLSSKLLASASYGNITAIEQILNQGGSINARGIYDETPLMAATTSGQIEAVHYLLTQKANVNLVNHQGSTALHIAAENDYPDIAELLLDYKSNIHFKNASGLDPWLIACHLGHKNTIERLRNRGANIYSVNKLGNNALLLAIQANNPFMIKTLAELTGHRLLHRKNHEGLSAHQQFNLLSIPAYNHAWKQGLITYTQIQNAKKKK